MKSDCLEMNEKIRSADQSLTEWVQKSTSKPYSFKHSPKIEPSSNSPMFTFQDQLSESDENPVLRKHKEYSSSSKRNDNTVYLSETGNSPQMNRILNQSSSRKIESYQSLSPESNYQTPNLYESQNYEV